uniref:COMM domain-containing protein n=1 Tax=Parascaris univalens TaxID=6257 RepID=A0A915AJG6_PARUN
MVHPSRLIELDDMLIDDVWIGVVRKTSIERDLHSLSDEELSNLSSLIELLERLNNLSRFDNPDKLLTDSNLSSRNCEHISRLWHASKLQESKDDWSADVVIGNSRIQKSLYVKITLPIGPHLIEMSVEKFGALRFEVARALQRLESYL